MWDQRNRILFDYSPCKNNRTEISVIVSIDLWDQQTELWFDYSHREVNRTEFSVIVSIDLQDQRNWNVILRKSTCELLNKILFPLTLQVELSNEIYRSKRLLKFWFLCVCKADSWIKFGFVDLTISQIETITEISIH